MKKLISLLLASIYLAAAAAAQGIVSEQPEQGGSIALSPARFELEMKPGTETTVVVNLDYRSAGLTKQSARIVASLSDWTITKDGQVEYFAANSRPLSASPWIIYSPGETSVVPGKVHQIRVTISVPLDAAPGDHLAALTVEQRPDSIQHDQAGFRRMIVRYRMASVFYIKVPGLTRKGSIEDLYARSASDGILILPTLKNNGNSVVRPLTSVKILDGEGKVVADLPDIEPFPLLAGAELNRPIRVDKFLMPGKYSVKYRVDFQYGGKIVEGVTELVVKPAPQIANSTRSPTDQ